jgi:hypothetical protein
VGLKQLSSNIFVKHLLRLQSGAPLTHGELLAIIRAINSTASDLQAGLLVAAAENCNCETPKGLLIGFISVSHLYGQRFEPVFRQVENARTAAV